MCNHQAPKTPIFASTQLRNPQISPPPASNKPTVANSEQKIEGFATTLVVWAANSGRRTPTRIWPWNPAYSYFNSSIIWDWICCIECPSPIWVSEWGSDALGVRSCNLGVGWGLVERSAGNGQGIGFFQHSKPSLVAFEWTLSLKSRWAFLSS